MNETLRTRDDSIFVMINVDFLMNWSSNFEEWGITKKITKYSFNYVSMNPLPHLNFKRMNETFTVSDDFQCLLNVEVNVGKADSH